MNTYVNWCRNVMIAVIGTGLLVGSVQVQAQAFGRRAPDYSSGYVVVESREGNGNITAQVREAQRGGYEYRVPGGGWHACEGDCEATIANKVLDFWDNIANKGYPGRGLTITLP